MSHLSSESSFNSDSGTLPPRINREALEKSAVYGSGNHAEIATDQGRLHEDWVISETVAPTAFSMDSRISRYWQDVLRLLQRESTNTFDATPVLAGEVLAALERLDEFKDLRANWDSYGAHPIPLDAIDHARDLLIAVAQRNHGRPGVATPYVVGPIPWGGVQIEWRRPGREIEVEVGPGSYLAYLTIEGVGDDRVFDEADGVSSDTIMGLIAWVLADESSE